MLMHNKLVHLWVSLEYVLNLNFCGRIFSGLKSLGVEKNNVAGDDMKMNGGNFVGYDDI